MNGLAGLGPSGEFFNQRTSLKILFTGGVKSGKSRLAEGHMLERFGPRHPKPYYLATAEYIDQEMRARIEQHRQRRQTSFITVEEPLHLLAGLDQCRGAVLIECVTLWLNNALYYHRAEADILDELAAVMRWPGHLILVHNEVGFGLVPDHVLGRRFIDLAGKAGQLMAAACDEVYFCCAGLKLRLK